MNTSPFYGSNQYYPTTYPTAPTYMPTSTFQPNVQPSLINGRSVDNLEEITAQEVPMNGSLAIFPKKDGSIIYVKSTNGNGTIDTKYYVPAPEGFVETATPGSSVDDQPPTISNQDLMAFMINMQSQIDDLKTLLQKRPNKNNRSYNNQNGNKGKSENNE